jgi:hypothetical protein
LNYSYDNGTFTEFGASPTYLNYTNATAGFYSYTWNTSGDTNYTADSISSSYNILKATPILSMINSSDFIYNGLGGFFNVSIITINNQLNATFWINGVNFSSINTTLNYTTYGGAGIYSGVFNTTGNTNYTSASISGSFTINQATPILTISNSSNFTYNNSNGYYNVSISTINNQLVGTLWINGISTVNTNTNINYSSNLATGGEYIGIFNTTGNQNYTSGTTDYANFTILQATPPSPILLINDSDTSTNTITNQSISVIANVSSINNQLTWNVNYYYPNGTIVLFNTTNINDSNNFKVINTPLSTYNFTINTTGNQNYTAMDTNNITDNVYQAFINLLIYNLNNTLTYPNVPEWNVTPNYNASNNITLNVSINSQNAFSSNVTNGINTTLNNTNSILTFGNLTAGTYTIIFNASDALGNYLINETTFTINLATPNITLGNCINFTYNGSSCTENASINSYDNQLSGEFNYSINNGTITSNNITSGNISNVEAASGYYNYSFVVVGNANYTPASLQADYYIFKATPSLPELLFNGSNSNIDVLNLSTVNVSSTNVSYPNQASFDNQLNWNIYYYYPNGTLNNTPLNISNVNISTNFTPDLLGSWNFIINTTGNGNYTAISTSNLTLQVGTPFIALFYYLLNNPTYPNAPVYNITPEYNGQYPITLNISLISPTGSEIFSNQISPNINTTINDSNSALKIGSLPAGTYNIYFVVNDSLGNTISNTTTFTISKGTPNITFVNSSGDTPSNYIYNNVNQSFYINNSIYETGFDTPNNLVFNAYLNNNLIGNPEPNASFNYIQNGDNLSVGTYNYTINTSGNENYTSNSINLSFSINQATPVITLSPPFNFTYNGSGEELNYSINTIDNQSTAYLSYNLTDNNNNVFAFNNVSNSTTSNSYITDPRSGLFNITLFAPVTQNYTSAFVNGIFRILQANGSIVLSLNGLSQNITSAPNVNIPVIAYSNESNISNPLLTLYLNGSSIASTSGNYSSINELMPMSGTQSYSANVINNNYTTAAQTFSVTINASEFNATFEPTYNYTLPSGNINSTTPNVFNLLNYSYDVNYSSTYALSNISINFGNGDIQTIQNPNSSGNLILYNNYTDNSIINYNITVTLNDIYNNTATFNFSLNTIAYVNASQLPPKIYFYTIANSTPQNYTYENISSPIFFNITQGSFNISNITVNFGDNNITTFSANTVEVPHTYTAVGNYTITVTATDINGFNSSITNTFQVLNFTYASITIQPPDSGYTINQTYTFKYTQGTFAGNYVTINWGDSSTTVFSLPNNGISQEFTLYHNYTTPSSYYVSTNVTDVEGFGTYTNVLTNPLLNISLFVYPTVNSITPNNPSNGATNLTNNYTFTLISGSLPTANITINWGDNSSQLISNITNNTLVISHTYDLFGNYVITTDTCDTSGNCNSQSFNIDVNINTQTNGNGGGGGGGAVSSSSSGNSNINSTLLIIGGIGIVILILGAILRRRRK